MNILIMGRYFEDTFKLNTLLKISQQNVNVTSVNKFDLFSPQINYQNWDIAVFLLTQSEVSFYEAHIDMCLSKKIKTLLLINSVESINQYINYLQKGVDGIVGYHSPLETLKSAIKNIHQGYRFIDPLIIKSISSNYEPDTKIVELLSNQKMDQL